MYNRTPKNGAPKVAQCSGAAEPNSLTYSEGTFSRGLVWKSCIYIKFPRTGALVNSKHLATACVIIFIMNENSSLRV